MTKNETPPGSDSKPSAVPKLLYDQRSLGDDYDGVVNQQHAELLTFFDALSEAQRSDVLRNLRADKEEQDFSQIPIKSDQVEATPEEIEKAELYDNIMKERRAQALRLKYNSPSVPSHSLSSGLQITLSSRNDRDLRETRIIIRKDERGSDAITRKKTHDKVVKALDPKISAGNLSRILTSTDVAAYDVAADALSWQSTLKDIKKFCVQYDMMALLLIPQDVDLSAPDVVAKARTFKNAIDDWKTLDDKDYFEWQEFILRYGSFEDATSDNWLDDVLLLSMEKTLRAEVESDITNIPRKQHGSITTLRCIIKRMVIKNQEAKDALENYIRDFNITKFPGENVPTACLRLKAVARALGTEDLPSNTIRKVLEGFGMSSTKTFNDFCSSEIALRRGSTYSDIMRKTSLLSQLNNLLGDIEAAYIDLVGGNKWESITASPPVSSFLASPSVDDAAEEEQA